MLILIIVERSSSVTGTNKKDESYAVLEEAMQLLSPDSPCLTASGPSAQESDEELSANFEGIH